MRHRSVITVLAFGLLCAAAPAADRPVIQSDKARPVAGSTIRVVGNGFIPHAQAEIFVGPPEFPGRVRLGSARVSARGGAFEKTVRLPKGLTGSAALLGCQRDCRVKDIQRIKVLPAR